MKSKKHCLELNEKLKKSIKIYKKLYLHLLYNKGKVKIN